VGVIECHGCSGPSTCQQGSRSCAVSKCDAMGMNGSVIVWDLETVPDIGGFAAANYLIGKTDNEVRQLIGDKFPSTSTIRSSA
jgi:hypothetical protein